MDDAPPKKRKPLTAREQLRNVLEGLLAEGGGKDSRRLTKRESLETLWAKVIKKVEDDEPEPDRKTAELEWRKRAKKKKEPPGSGYVM